MPICFCKQVQLAANWVGFAYLSQSKVVFFEFDSRHKNQKPIIMHLSVSRLNLPSLLTRAKSCSCVFGLKITDLNVELKKQTLIRTAVTVTTVFTVVTMKS